MKMKYYRFPENRITKIGFAAFLFAILMLCRDTLITSSIIGFYKATFISYGFIALVGIGFLWVNRKNLKDILLDERMLLALVATVIFVVPMLAKQDWQLLYFSILICIYLAIFLSYFVSLEDMGKVYVVIITLLGAWSCLSTYALKPLTENGILNVPVFSNGMLDFYNFGLSYSPIRTSIYDMQTYRNFGIFREPGVYQFFIIMALILNNYLINWNKKETIWLVNILLAITMLTTFATGGVIELGLLAIVLYLDKKWYKNKTICICSILAFLALAAIVIYSCISKNVLFSVMQQAVRKLVNFNPTTSGGVRVQSILVDMQIFMNNPVFGERLRNVMFVEGLEFNTTSTMILLAGYGFFAGSFHVISWIALLWDRNRRAWVNLALILIMFMSFNTQDLSADMFLWLFPIMAMAEKGIPFVKTLRSKGKV